ncbi:MAG: OmpH family outer membrane protein [Acidobacteriota bacterium]|nr:OmpH family outer membrane protein [Acidobacteriota bacterium]
MRPLLVCLALIPFGGLAQAQTKVGVVNMQRAVMESAEIKAASAAMEAKYKPRVAQIDQLNKEIAAISENLQRNSGKLTPQAEATMTSDGQRKQREAQRLQEDLQTDVDRERNDILGKATTKMQGVVKQVADAKGLDLVVDVPYTVFFKAALDITSDAITAYDKAYPASAPPAAK